MSVALPQRRRWLVAVALLAAPALAACDHSPTQPASKLTPVVTTPRADGEPTEPCRSGWVVVQGHWVCYN